VFNIGIGRTANLDGGIKGDAGTFVQKTGAGDLIFENGAIVDYQGDLKIEGGSVVLDIGSGIEAKLGGKIQGDAGTIITKMGAGDLRFNAGSSIAFAGTFNVNDGKVIFSTNAYINDFNVNAGSAIFSSNAYINTLSIGANATLGLTVDFTGNLSSILYLVTLSTDTTSKLLVETINPIAGSSIAVIYANSITGLSNPLIAHFDDIISGAYQYSFDWLAGSNGYNWTGYLILASIPQTQDIIKSGKFLANTLSLAAQSHGLDDIYNRINSGAIDQKGDSWVGLYGSGHSIDDFSVSGFGGAFGADLYKNQNLMGGLFVRYGSNNIKEKANKGTMGEMEFGLYGGLFEIKNSPINVKANLSMGIQSYSMEIGETVDFDGKSVKGGFEVEYVSPLTPTTKIRPFIGFQGGLAMNDDVKTSIATIKSDSLFRAETKLGVGISGKLGAVQNFNWFGRLYGIFLVSGDEPKYKIADNAGGNEIEVIGAKEGSIQGAISLGGEYQVSPAISIFANAGADFGEGFGWIGGLGANYKFGMPTNPSENPSAVNPQKPIVGANDYSPASASASDRLKELQVFASAKKYLSDNGLTGYTDEQLAEVIFENGKLAPWIKTDSKGEITNQNDMLVRLMKKYGYPK
jgi:hypothetical protein